MRLQLNGILKTFTKAQNQLERFVKQCDDDVDVAQAKIDEASRQKELVTSEKERANRSLTKIREILG